MLSFDSKNNAFIIMWPLLRLVSAWQASTICCSTKLLKKKGEGGGGGRWAEGWIYVPNWDLFDSVCRSRCWLCYKKADNSLDLHISLNSSPLRSTFCFFNTGIWVCQFAILSEKIHQKEGKQASYHHIPLMSRKCQPSSCHNKGTSKSQQRN